MPRPVVCPKCREELDIPEELRGGDVRCAVCATVFTAPKDMSDRSAGRTWDEPVVQPRKSSRRSNDDDDPRSSSWDQDDDDDRPARRRYRPEPRRSGALWLWLMLGGTFSICLLGCGGLMIFAVKFDNPKMELYKSPDGTFQAVFPGKNPVVTTQLLDDGQKQTRVEFVRKLMQQDFETFYIRYVDLPNKPKSAEIDKLFQTTADELVAKHPDSTEISRTDPGYVQQGYPAMDLHVVHDDDTMTIVRFLIVEKRLYSVGIKGRGLVPESQRLRAFWEGFRVLSADAVAVPDMKPTPPPAKNTPPAKKPRNQTPVTAK